MLDAGSPVPDVHVWATIREEPRPLREVLGEGWALLCFYVHDWSRREAASTQGSR